MSASGNEDREIDSSGLPQKIEFFETIDESIRDVDPVVRGHFRQIKKLTRRGCFGDNDRALHRSQQSRKVRPIEIEHIEENIGDSQEDTDSIGCPPTFRGMHRPEVRQHKGTDMQLRRHLA